MRYRPLGSSPAVVSAVSLNLAAHPSRPRPADWVRFIHAALENGISAFAVDADEPVVIDGMAEALSAVDRALVFVSWRLSSGAGFSPELILRRTQAGIARTGLDYLDAVMLNEPAPEALSGEVFPALGNLKESGHARMVGLIGEDPALDHHIAAGRFDVLTTAFNFASNERERDRLQAAKAHGMAVVGRWPHRGLLADGGAHGWTAQEISLAYALAEPSLCSVVVEAGSVGELRRLAAVADRELPPALAAGVDMALFEPADAEVEQRA